jgi:tRNA-splicing ligase RtcB
MNDIELLVHTENLDELAQKQISQISIHPAFQGLISIMPDAHAGAGCVIGFTGKFKNAVIPNIVGVDIGCGVITQKLEGIKKIDFPDLDRYIRHNIPLGMTWHKNTNFFEKEIFNNIKLQISELCNNILQNFYKKENVGKYTEPILQLGTLGGGNHFIEIDINKNNDFYLTVHTGSRNLGKQVADYFQKKAKSYVKQNKIDVPKTLEYLPINEYGKKYLYWAKQTQKYAEFNRQIILSVILNYFGLKFDKNKMIESVHNYISEKDDIVRKGAISAYKDEDVVIPLNMADGIILGKGKSNKLYNFSAPHGAGRKFGRRQMFRKLENGEFSMRDYKKSMEGIFSSSVNRKTFDESKFAYKSFDDIKDYLKETVEIDERLFPVYNLKAD